MHILKCSFINVTPACNLLVMTIKQEKRPFFIRLFKTALPGFLFPRKIIFSLFFCMLFICPASGFSSRLDTVIIRLKFRVATEVLPVV